MALRGMGTGGCSFALPPEYDETADLSVFLWVRSGGAITTSARILTVVNTARNRGFSVHAGGGVSGSSQTSDVVISAASGSDLGWGASVTLGGRGRAILSGLSETVFFPLAFSMRGSAAADNTGSPGAMQLHDVWWKGALAAIATTGIAATPPAQGGKVMLLCRDPSNLNGFNGWVAEVAVWQGHRLTNAEAGRLASGVSPLWIAPEKLLFCRSFRTGLAAEAGDADLTMIAGGAAIAPETHPPLLIEAAGAAHGMSSGDPLGPGGARELFPASGVMAHQAMEAQLLMPGGTSGVLPASGVLPHRALQAQLLARQRMCRAPVLHVRPERRQTDAGV